MDQKFLARDQFQCLLDALIVNGYLLLGPQVRQDAISYAPITNTRQLPTGIVDIQEPGSYTLQQTDDNLFFSWAAPAQSIKPFSFVPKENLWKSTKSTPGYVKFTETLPETQATAIIGVKACDLAALALQDKHFLQQDFVDPYYKQRRNKLFIVSVDCSYPANVCFCHSTGDGPSASKGYDINLTELAEGFLIRAANAQAQLIVDSLPLSKVTKNHLDQQSRQQQTAINKQKRALPAGDFASILKNRQQHSHWDDIGHRCLACGNCTSVCPSCFCHSESDESSLGSDQVTHIREWDSCFTQNHSYIHGIVIRPESTSRYRQWMTHKFSSWFEQYGRSGCTGCGRCISWCPVGIDVTKELDALCNDRVEITSE